MDSELEAEKLWKVLENLNLFFNFMGGLLWKNLPDHIITDNNNYKKHMFYINIYNVYLNIL